MAINMRIKDTPKEINVIFSHHCLFVKMCISVIAHAISQRCCCFPQEIPPLLNSLGQNAPASAMKNLQGIAFLHCRAMSQKRKRFATQNGRAKNGSSNIAVSRLLQMQREPRARGARAEAPPEEYRSFLPRTTFRRMDTRRPQVTELADRPTTRQKEDNNISDDHVRHSE